CSEPTCCQAQNAVMSKSPRSNENVTGSLRSTLHVEAILPSLIAASISLAKIAPFNVRRVFPPHIVRASSGSRLYAWSFCSRKISGKKGLSDQFSSTDIQSGGGSRTKRA